MARIHITGASGTGTTTLGRALALRLGTPHFDSDDYYWIPTWPPYAIKRDPGVRDARLREDLTRFDAWIWSGSALSWEVDAPMTLCVFLHLPTELRIERLRRREQAELRTMPGLSEVEIDRRIQEFLDWAAAYESGDREGRSRARHEAWLASLACPVL
ncbi:MAG: hypothetical protein AAGD14_10750, partial [Planctomycetota bacterium]